MYKFSPFYADHFTTSVLVCALALVLPAAIQAQTASAWGQTYVLAADGNATPDGKDTFTLSGSLAATDTGVVFLTHLTKANVAAIFSGNLTTKTELLREGNQIAGAGKVSSLTGNLTANYRGQALFDPNVTDASGTALSTLVAGGTTASLRPVIVSGQAPPDQVGTYYSAYGSINDAGETGFSASIENGGAPLDQCNGIFMGHADGTTTQILRSTQNAPGEAFTFSGIGGSMNTNQAGQVCFEGYVNDGHAGTATNCAIYRASNAADLTKIARSYEPAADTGSLFGWLQTSWLNNLNEVAFYAYLTDTADTNKGQGIFKATSSAAVKAIAYSGQSVPGALGTYTSFDNSLGINNAGQVAYVGYYTKGSTTGNALFIGDGTTQRVLLRTGQTAPDGSKFGGFNVARASDTGAVLFNAKLNSSTKYNSLWLTDGTETIKVAAGGDVVDGTAITTVGFDLKTLNSKFGIVYQAVTASKSRWLLFAPNLAWRTAGNGNWADATNWTVSLLPTVNNDVTIAPATGGQIIGPATDATMRSLRIGATTSGTAELAVRAGVLTVTGGVTVAPLGKLSGSGRVIGNVSSQAAVAPGVAGAGTLTIQGNYTQTATASFEAGIGGPAAGNYGTLAVTGNAALAGTLKPGVLIGDGLSQITASSVFPVLTVTGTLTGTFDNAPEGARLTTSDGLGSFQVNYTGQTVVLSHFVAADTDSDGIPDYWLKQYFGHVTAQGSDRSRPTDDADGDGFSNLAEFIAGTDPTSAASVFRAGLTTTAGGGLAVTFATVPARTYTVEGSTQPAAGGNWTPVATGIAGDGTVKTVSPGALSGATKAGFYRVSVAR